MNKLKNMNKIKIKKRLGRISIVEEGIYHEKCRKDMPIYLNSAYFIRSDEIGSISFCKENLRIEFGYRSTHGKKTYGRIMRFNKKQAIELRDYLNQIIQED